MGDIDVGGDSSVKWKVDVGHVRPGSIGNNGMPPQGHHQHGIDEVDAGQFFTISIEVPATQTDKNNLANALAAASTAMNGATAGSGVKVSFSLPVELHNEDQVKIYWNSAP